MRLSQSIEQMKTDTLSVLDWLNAHRNPGPKAKGSIGTEGRSFSAFLSRLVASATLLLWLLLGVYGQSRENYGAAAQTKAMQLVAPGTGWAMLDKHLFWTSNDGNEWREITPSDHPDPEVDGSFFLDESRGWTAVRARNSTRDSAFQLFVASTLDAGRHWTYRMIDHGGNSSLKLYSGNSSLYFVDTLHGWLMARLESSSNFSSGLLFATQNGARHGQRFHFRRQQIQSISSRRKWAGSQEGPPEERFG
jgi:hypothetical protein